LFPGPRTKTIELFNVSKSGSDSKFRRSPFIER
jgi:hypothetical protein